MNLLLATTEADSKLHQLQTQFGIEGSYLLMQIISFSILAFVLYRFFFKPVLATMDERNARISDGLKYAEEMKAKLADAEAQHAETLKKASVEAGKLVEEARNAAKELVDRETKAAAEKTQQMIARAEQAIDLERRKMVADVREEIARLVALTASRVLSRELSSDERKRYAESAARELTNV